MGVFGRIWRVFKANIHAMFDRADNPEHALETSLRDMQKQMNRIRDDVIRVVAEEKKLKNQVDRYQKEIERWDKNAVMAVKQGNDALAREALRRKRESLEFSQQLAPQWEQQQAISERLKQEYQGLRERIQSAERKKHNLVLRLRHAESQKRLQNLLTDLSDTQAFDRLERKIFDAEAMNEAQQELQASSLDQKFAELTGGADASVELELEALKERMKLNP